ncbi:MAG TPA: sigma-70 family RNA polymerase sigma factor [Caulifigura sp.]|nr:sigma-70 family RNA polymerase sigma factor [Caulifigura sp.]
MTSLTRLSDSDAELWALVCNDDLAAFRNVVERHQSAVSAVAYAVCGEFAASEDAAQEAFLTAWRERTTLREPSRLRAWLCGIGRNIARNFRRQHERRSESHDVSQIAALDQSPEQAAISREEEALVWENLERIPEPYREPLVLFYRESQSVADVAQALDLTEDAVRQRLSRGRALLREQVMSVVERALTHSRPKSTFTTGVLAGVTVLAGKGTVASAATTSAPFAAKTLAVGSAGAFGGLLGGIGGTAGGWFGTWCSAQMAPTATEREYLLKTGRWLVAISIAFTALCYGLVHFGFRPSTWQIVGCVFGFQAVVGLFCFVTWRRVQQIRRTTSPESDPNITPLKQRAMEMATRNRGRRHRSTRTLLGLPLLDIQVSDPMLPGSSTNASPPLKACGWIAIGDHARGILFACGHRALGTVAIGDITFGLVSFGAISAGGIAIGGLSLGLVAFGGLSIGGLAVGGFALGWLAIGGGALAADVAVGGLAAAWHSAFGGAAFAHHFAVGGQAIAAHANDAEAKARLLNHPAKLAMDWSQHHQAIWVPILVAVCVGVPLLVNRLRYQQATPISAT